MGAIDAYGYAGVGTCVGFLVGLILGFFVSELAWCTIVCTAVASLLGTVLDFKTRPIDVMRLSDLDD